MPMDLFDWLKLVDLSLFIEKPRILVIGDMHLGLEGNLVNKGVFIPKFHFNELFLRISKIVKQTLPKTIIINGDLKHEFERISADEWRDSLKLIDLLSEYSELILLRGNHDTILGPVARKRNIKIMEFFKYNDIYICHGHKIPKCKDFQKAKIVVIGHEHPAITIDDTIRREKFKCFLVGKYRQKKLIVLPSFNLLAEGTDILKERLISPFLEKIDDFRVLVVGDKIYDFGKVKMHYKEKAFFRSLSILFLLFSACQAQSQTIGH